MNKREFLRQRQPSWKRFDALIGDLRQKGSRLPTEQAGEKTPRLREPPVSEFSRLFREISNDLATVRARGWGESLEKYLNDLMGRGHNVFYSAPPASFAAVTAYLTRGFPRLFRANIGYFLAASLLFFGPLGITWAAGWLAPPLAARIVPNEMLESFESMYGAESSETEPVKQGQAEAAESDGADAAKEDSETSSLPPARDLTEGDWRQGFGEERNVMFGFYVYNNVGIALRCFALGVLLGAGTVYVLLFNGIFIGAVAGYVCGTGHADRFLSFVVSHGSFELTAIAIAGGAGLMLGNAILHPGSRGRVEALKVRALDAVQIALGAGAMLVVAALIEAFWSPSGVPAVLKYGVGAGLWVAVFLYLGLAGRDRAAA